MSACLSHSFLSCAGFILIDRSGKHFAKLLNFLRDGAVPLPDSLEESSELLVEAKYYLLEELAAQLEVHIEQIRKDNLTVCRMPMVTSVEEFQRVLTGTRKVIIYGTCTCNVTHVYTRRV